MADPFDCDCNRVRTSIEVGAGIPTYYSWFYISSELGRPQGPWWGESQSAHDRTWDATVYGWSQLWAWDSKRGWRKILRYESRTNGPWVQDASR